MPSASGIPSPRGGTGDEPARHPDARRRDPLTGLLTAGTVAAVLATVCALTMPSRPHPPGLVHGGRRLRLAVLGTVVLGLVAGVADAAMVGNRHLAWSASVLLLVSYLVFMFRWTLNSPLLPTWSFLSGEQ